MSPDRSPTQDIDHRSQLRIWLRLLTCTQMIERRVRTGLRLAFDTTLPRFDVMSQLDASDGTLSMGELSTRLMVTSGNVTSLIDSMERDGLVERRPHPVDRRSTLIRMTRRGCQAFAEMVPLHGDWINAMMAGLSRTEMRTLLELLDRLKQSVRDGEESLAASDPERTTLREQT